MKSFHRYEVVIPTRTNEQGEHLPRHRHFLNKRSTDSVSRRQNGRIFYTVDAFGRTFRLTLSPHIGFVAPGLRLHHLDVNDTWMGEEAADSEHCYHRGSVTDDPDSVVVVSVCEQLVSNVAALRCTNLLIQYTHCLYCTRYTIWYAHNRDINELHNVSHHWLIVTLMIMMEGKAMPIQDLRRGRVTSG